jgi:dihydrofolate synthase/folylpolyglutamate synthase
MDHRFLYFKSADDWMKYQNEFGNPDAFSSMNQYLHRMSHDIAMMQVLGPNPHATMNFIRQSVLKDAAEQRVTLKDPKIFKRAEKNLNDMDDLFELYNGSAYASADESIIPRTLQGVRNLNNAAFLGSTAITSISKDHMQFLGDTLELIAKEKAGIIKEKIPVVLGEIPTRARAEILAIAKNKNAPVTFSTSLLPPKSALEGSYQLFNERTSFGILLELQKLNWNISNENIENGFLRVIENTHLMGRWQVLGNHPLTVAEVAHNEEGITFLVEKLKTLSFKKLHIVIGMVNDKDHSQVLSLLPKEAEYYLVQADIPRALPKEELQAKALEFMLKGSCYANVHSGLEAAKAASSKDDLIVVTGSIFTVAEILPEED